MNAHSASRFLLPVTRQVDRFVPDQAARVASGDLPELLDFQAYFRLHYRRLQAPVEIEGLSYICTVYEPIHSNDIAYAVVDRNGLPEEPEPIDQVALNTSEYFSALRRRLAYSEGMPPVYRTYLHTEFVAPAFCELRRSDGGPQRQITWPELTQRSRAVIVGAPGSGKTTCLRRLAIDATEHFGDPASSRIPVYLQLREATPDVDLADWVRRELVLRQAVSGEDDVSAIFASGRLLLLLDGLDEVAQGSDRLTGAILVLARRFPKLGIHIATRSAGYHWRFPGFLHLQLEPFGPLEIEEWLTKRISRLGSGIATTIIRRFETDPRLAQLATSPLMLAMAARLLERGQTASTTRTTLFSRYVDLLLDEWDSVRGVTREAPASLDRDRMMEALCRAAYFMFQSRRTTFATTEFAHLENIVLAEQPAEDTLNALWRNSGILQPATSADEWGFVHKSYTEFLAAKYLVERTDDLLSKYDVAADEFNDFAVWTFACGLTQDASGLVNQMLGATRVSDITRCQLFADVLAQGATINKPTFDRTCLFVRKQLEEWASHRPMWDPESLGAISDTFSASAPDELAKTLRILFVAFNPGPRRIAVARILRQSESKAVADLGHLLAESNG